MKGKLNKKLVEAIAPGDKDILLWDTDLIGFGCKITPKGKRVYVLQYRANGQLKRFTIGPHGALTPDGARREATRLLGEVAKGVDPSTNKQAERKAPTVHELVQRYLDEHATLKKKASTVAKDRQWLNRFIIPELGRLKVQDVNRAQVAKLHHSLRDTPYQANRVLEVLRKMFNLAEKWGLRPDGSNPCRHVEKFKERKRERFLSPDELARLGHALAEAEKDGSLWPSFITAVRLLLFTGCRLGEVLGLRWEDVDLNAGCLRLPDSKTGAKTVTLSVPALQVLADITGIEGNPYVCPGLKPGGPLVGIHRLWYRLRAEAGLKGVRLHDLRHSFASVGVAAGMGLPIVGALLGHTQAATTQRYAHLHQDPLRAAADEIAGRIAEAMAQPVPRKVLPLTPKK